MANNKLLIMQRIDDCMKAGCFTPAEKEDLYAAKALLKQGFKVAGAIDYVRPLVYREFLRHRLVSDLVAELGDNDQLF